MPVVWSIGEANTFWNGRHTYCVLNDHSVNEKIPQMESEDEVRKRTQSEEYRNFVSDSEDKFLPSSNENDNLKGTSRDLQFWIEFSSWAYCNTCSFLSRDKLFQ